MPRYSAEAAVSQQISDGRGPITEHLLKFERRQQKRFGLVGRMRRPRYVLDALRAGEPVVVPVSLIPRALRRPGWEIGDRVRVTPDM